MVWAQTRRSSCINLHSNCKGEKKEETKGHRRDLELSNDCVVASWDGRKLYKGVGGENMQAEVINRKWSISFHKALTNLRKWHQFPKGQPAPLLYLLLNTKLKAWTMKDGFRSARLPPLTLDLMVCTVQSQSSYWLLCGNSSKDLHLKEAFSAALKQICSNIIEPKVLTTGNKATQHKYANISPANLLHLKFTQSLKLFQVRKIKANGVRGKHCIFHLKTECEILHTFF